MQKINDKLYIYSVSNYPILKNETIFFKVNIYLLNSGKVISQNETIEIGFNSLEDYGGNDNKIIKFESNETFNESIGFNLEVKNEKNIQIKLNENKNNLNTEKVKEEIIKGEVDYNKISSDYIIHKYSVISSNNGCDFSLNLKEIIDINNTKKLNLDFIEVDNNKNKISAECVLSSANKNRIQCKLNKETNKNYILEPFIYSDNTETFIINQNYINDFISLKCLINDKDGISIGAIIGIVLGGLGVIIIIILVLYFIFKRKGNKEENKIILLILLFKNISCVFNILC